VILKHTKYIYKYKHSYVHTKNMGLSYYAPFTHSVVRNISLSQAVHLDNPGILKNVIKSNWATIDKHRLVCLLDQAKNTKKNASISVIESFIFMN